MAISLRDLAAGDRGKVVDYDRFHTASYRRKLLSMGLTPGTETSIGFSIPAYITFIAVGETITLGSPTTYEASNG